MTDLKERLIERIQSTSNPDVLKEIYRLLEIDLDDQEVYELSSEQTEAIEEAQRQIARGDYLTNKQANKAVEDWLRKK